MIFWCREFYFPDEVYQKDKKRKGGKCAVWFNAIFNNALVIS
jgi:hypothetical protein